MQEGLPDIKPWTTGEERILYALLLLCLAAMGSVLYMTFTVLIP